MKRLLLPLVAAAALAIPASGLAWDGHHSGDGDHNGRFATLSGTGTAFSGGTATATGSVVAGNDHPNGHFSASISTNWSAAQTHTFTDNDGDSDDGAITVSCAPSTATLTLSNGTTTNSSLTGKTCTKTRNGSTTKAGFFGFSSTGVPAFLKEDGTTVKGLVFSGGTAHEDFHLGFSFRLGFHH
jgi:hypothetical protein